MSENGQDQDGFITLPPGIAPPSIDADSATHKVVRREREEITFFQGPPGAAAPTAAEPAAPPPEAVGEHPPAAPEDDAEATRLGSARHAAPAWRIVLPGRPPLTVDAPLYLGRNPVVPDDDPDARAIAVDDPAKSVSKTHARLEVEGGLLWVADLDSTNGVWIVTPDGDATDVSPGRPMQVPAGADIELGDYVIQVERG